MACRIRPDAIEGAGKVVRPPGSARVQESLTKVLMGDERPLRQDKSLGDEAVHWVEPEYECGMWPVPAAPACTTLSCNTATPLLPSTRQN